ncbi:cytochrome P450 [Streptomyces olivaceus]|uniref:cytochrome P450 n=1 Tax=Streptomyces olivaceus TaxID=47716 RepID=UPI001CCEB0E3|nr:cytochrome P450 [Streptomyces olivaceus]MBZ6228984.1 cytochrome P450 [Streptomyces olivaceus]
MPAEDLTPSPFTETTGTDRHAAVAALRESGPVQRVTLFTGGSVWLVTGHAEVEELRPRAQETTDDVLDALGRAGAEGSPVDLVAALGHSLPSTVIAGLPGVPVDHREAFRGWSPVVVNASAYPAGAYPRAAEEMVAHVREMISDKRRTPADDLLSALIHVHDGDDRSTADELTLSGAVHSPLSHPAQPSPVREEPDRLAAVVEEQLRHDGPKQVLIRPAVPGTEPGRPPSLLMNGIAALPVTVA